MTLNGIIEWQYSAFLIYTIDPYLITATAERLKRLPEQRRRRLRVVRGHLLHGIHEFLPQGATIDYNASRTGGPISIILLFYFAKAASSRCMEN